MAWRGAWPSIAARQGMRRLTRFVHRSWLSKAGLSRYIPRFVAEGVDDDAFKALLMQARRGAAVAR